MTDPTSSPPDDGHDDVVDPSDYVDPSELPDGDAVDVPHVDPLDDEADA